MTVVHAPRRPENNAGTQRGKPSPKARRQARLRSARIVGIVCVVIGVCAYLDRETTNFDLLEQKTYGERLEVAARADAPTERRARSRIVLVPLTDSTFAPKSGVAPQPYLPRADHAAVIRHLTDYGAKVIAVDLLFDTPQPGDDALSTAIRDSKRVLLACGDSSAASPELLLPVPRLCNAGATWGHTRCPIDADRPALDRVPPAVAARGRWVPAFCVEAARMALGCTGKPLRSTPDGWRCGALSIPVDEDGTFRLRYGAPGSAGFTTIPYEDVFAATKAQTPFYRGVFQDKIVLIGDTTHIHGDLHLTPLGIMSGVEIQANAIATLLAGRSLRDAPWTADLAAMIVLGALATLAATLWRLEQSLLMLAMLVPAYFLFNVWLFVERDTALHLVAPTVALLATGGCVFLERIVSEEYEKTQRRALLRRYVSPPIVEHLLEHPELMGGVGSRATGTILFCDIRGFTALSERIPPEELIAGINEYFEEMTEIIFRNTGTVASIAGDALLAVFGVPVPSDDHARRAVAAAIAMQDALPGIQARWRERWREDFDIGIGINTGEMVAGDIGSSQLMNFTVYGLHVNIASRIEELTKEKHMRILVSDSTYQAVQDEVAARGPFAASLRGVEGLLVDVYQVLGWHKAP